MTFACVFPGQGSQSVGMLTELLGAESIVKSCFQEASDALGYDLSDLVLNGPEEKLNSTHHTQPSLLAAGVSLWRLWCQQTDLRPQMMAGHSLGEYTALVCSGVLAFDSAVRLVELRGKAMQEAVPAGTGAMAAILGLDDKVVIDACTQAAGTQVVAAVNFNAPGQVVIAGAKDAVGRAIELAKEMGARKAIPLPVSVPSHCALMMPAAEALGAALDDISLSAGSIPVVHNVDVQVHSEPQLIKSALVKQIHKPVQWVDTVLKMKSLGVGKLIELGPGKVLSGLNRRIDRTMSVKPVFDSATLANAISDLEDTHDNE